MLQGMNGTVFAYGATGSGKTYTMAGAKSASAIVCACAAQMLAGREACYAAACSRGEQQSLANRNSGQALGAVLACLGSSLVAGCTGGDAIGPGAHGAVARGCISQSWS